MTPHPGALPCAATAGVVAGREPVFQSPRHRVTLMEYATKLLVIVSMAGAIAVETLVTAGVWPALLPLTIRAFVAAAAISILFDEACAAIVLVFAYVMPALILVVHGNLLLYFGHVWSAALLGAIVPRSVRSGWAVPRPWRAPLVLWALTIALTWPIIAFRELDFTARLLGVTHLANSGLGGPPPVAAAGVADNAMGLGLAILWFDWLFAAFAHAEGRFRRFVITGNAVSWAIATAVGAYQLFGNMSFLNRGLYGAMGRASGTLLDANPFGVIAAAWGPALVAAAWLTRDWRLRALSGCALVASWIGMWASAARTAFGVGCIASGFLAYAAWSTQAHRASPRTRSRIGTAGAIAAVALVAALVWLPATTGPLPRLRGMAPKLSAASISGFVREMWDRNGYGATATDLVRAFPFAGVGIGSFHILVFDYHYQQTHVVLPPDNAQNWYRHQFVENGIAGSIGWILWVATFGWFVLTARAPPSTRFPATIVKGIVVGMAVVSLVGIPTQNIAVSIALVTFAFWYVVLAGGVDQAGSRVATSRISRPAWAAIWIVVLAAAAATLHTARTELRVPARAARFGWGYFYGFSDVEPALDIARRSSVWATRHAVAVLIPPARWVKLTVSVDRLNLAKGPVAVKVACDDSVVVDTEVSDVRPITRYVAVRDGNKGLMVETWVSRSVRPAAYGLPDRRELGLFVEWEFSAPQ
jgi:hypothetical protein